MNINDLRVKLNNLFINPVAYSLEGGSCDECYILSKEGSGKWKVYYSERGLRSSCKTFDNEAEACEDLLRRLEKDPTVKIK
jgi:hypothetical protein